ARRADRRRQRRPRRQPLYRSQHRGHADRRRGDRVQGRRGRGPGQRDRRTGASRRYPGDRVDFVAKSEKPFYVEPLFTRDPGDVTETQILTAMLAIKGIYAAYGVRRLNHGIGFNTAAIELLLPTYGERLGLKGKIATHFALNPHPTLIPAIESGWVQQIHCFGGEVGME